MLNLALYWTRLKNYFRTVRCNTVKTHKNTVVTIVFDYTCYDQFDSATCALVVALYTYQVQIYSKDPKLWTECNVS